MEDQILEEHFTAIQSDFNQIYERFEQVDQRFDEVDQRFNLMDKRFDKVENKLDRLETVGYAILEVISGNDAKLKNFEGRLLRLEQKVFWFFVNKKTRLSSAWRVFGFKYLIIKV